MNIVWNKLVFLFLLEMWENFLFVSYGKLFIVTIWQVVTHEPVCFTFIFNAFAFKKEPTVSWADNLSPILPPCLCLE